MKLRRYLNLKKITYPEAADIPRYALNKLRAHRRPLQMLKENPRDDNAATRGITPSS